MRLNNLHKDTYSVDTVGGRETKVMIWLKWQSEGIRPVVIASCAVGDIPWRLGVVELGWISCAIQGDWCITYVDVEVTREDLQ